MQCMRPVCSQLSCRSHCKGKSRSDGRRTLYFLHEMYRCLSEAGKEAERGDGAGSFTENGKGLLRQETE